VFFIHKIVASRKFNDKLPKYSLIANIRSVQIWISPDSVNIIFSDKEVK